MGALWDPRDGNLLKFTSSQILDGRRSHMIRAGFTHSGVPVQKKNVGAPIILISPPTAFTRHAL